jgi:hypothetical protein
MKLHPASAALLGGLILAGSAHAAPVVVDFETPNSFASIAEHYNGGTDSLGLAGVNLGVSFGLDALALRNDELGPYFSNAEGLGVLSAVGAESTMNVAAGFTGVASVLYAGNAVANVGIWSGLNGTGTRLGQFELSANSAGCAANTPLCVFTTASFDLGAGVAKSITFGESVSGESAVVFDKVTVAAVPEPGTYALMGLGLVGIAGVARRRARNAA